MNFFEMLFHSTNKGPDIAAMGAIIGAGISYLVSRGRKLVSSKIFRFILPGQNGKNFRLTGPFKRAIQSHLSRRLENPHIDSARIRGYKHHYKIKLRSVGYRLVYEVEEKEVTVYVICVGRRDTIYKILKKRKQKIDG